MAKKGNSRTGEKINKEKPGARTQNLDDLSKMHGLDDESRPGVKKIWPVKKVFSRQKPQDDKDRPLGEDDGGRESSRHLAAKHSENDGEAAGKAGAAVSLDDLSDEQFLAMYGDKEESVSPGTRIRRFFKGLLKGITFPYRWYKEKVNNKDIDPESARFVVNMVGIVGGLLFILALALGSFIIYSSFTSYNSYMEQAKSYQESGNTERAAGSYEKAFQAARSGEEKKESAMALGDLYYEEHSDLNAAYYYEKVIEQDHSNIPALTRLLQLYEQRNDLQSIIEAARIAEGTEAKALFSNYLLSQPVFNYKSGTYNERITVEITAGEAENIYYTLDNTEATQDSTLYTGPIQLEEGDTVFHAIAINRNGLMSENIVVTYEIITDEPRQPEISPASGTYRSRTEISLEIPDGCRAYYTFDGTEPTAESAEYTEPVEMPVGNNIFTAIFISQNGVKSKPSSRVYDMIYSTPVTKTEAIYKVKEGLVNNGVLKDVQGSTVDENAGGANFYCTQVITINEQQYYKVDCHFENNQIPSTSYAVHVDSGAVFSLSVDGAGNYTLNGF